MGAKNQVTRSRKTKRQKDVVPATSVVSPVKAVAEKNNKKDEDERVKGNKAKQQETQSRSLKRGKRRRLSKTLLFDDDSDKEESTPMAKRQKLCEDKESMQNKEAKGCRLAKESKRVKVVKKKKAKEVHQENEIKESKKVNGTKSTKIVIEVENEIKEPKKGKGTKIVIEEICLENEIKDLKKVSVAKGMKIVTEEIADESKGKEGKKVNGTKRSKAVNEENESKLPKGGKSKKLNKEPVKQKEKKRSNEMKESKKSSKKTKTANRCKSVRKDDDTKECLDKEKNDDKKQENKKEDSVENKDVEIKKEMNDINELKETNRLMDIIEINNIIEREIAKDAKTDGANKIFAHCEKCNRNFQSKRAHTRHLKKCDTKSEEHVKNNPHKCDLCSFRGSKQAALVRHLETHGTFKCLKCDFVGESKEVHQKHMEEHHKPGSKICRVCHMFINTDQISMVKHKEECAGRTLFHCKECNKEFRYESSMNIHFGTHFPDQPKRFQCTECKYQSNYKANLQKHMKNMHECREKNIKCLLCDKLFYSEDSMKKHLKVHSEERPYQCDMCSKSFKTLPALKSHRDVHDPTRPYKCGIDGCTKDFRTPRLLKNHREEFHQLLPKKYHCSVEGCNFSFFKRSHLRRHEITHTGERNFLCNWPDCKKAFRHSDNLKVHYLQHTNEKPVKCNLCDFSCRQKSSLHWHKRKHHMDTTQQNQNNFEKVESTVRLTKLFDDSRTKLQACIDLYEFQSDDSMDDTLESFFKRSDRNANNPRTPVHVLPKTRSETPPRTPPQNSSKFSKSSLKASPMSSDKLADKSGMKTPKLPKKRKDRQKLSNKVARSQGKCNTTSASHKKEKTTVGNQETFELKGLVQIDDTNSKPIWTPCSSPSSVAAATSEIPNLGTKVTEDAVEEQVEPVLQNGLNEIENIFPHDPDCNHDPVQLENKADANHDQVLPENGADAKPDTDDEVDDIMLKTEKHTIAVDGVAKVCEKEASPSPPPTPPPEQNFDESSIMDDLLNASNLSPPSSVLVKRVETPESEPKSESEPGESAPEPELESDLEPEPIFNPEMTFRLKSKTEFHFEHEPMKPCLESEPVQSPAIDLQSETIVCDLGPKPIHSSVEPDLPPNESKSVQSEIESERVAVTFESKSDQPDLNSEHTHLKIEPVQPNLEPELHTNLGSHSMQSHFDPEPIRANLNPEPPPESPENPASPSCSDQMKDTSSKREISLTTEISNLPTESVEVGTKVVEHVQDHQSSFAPLPQPSTTPVDDRDYLGQYLQEFVKETENVGRDHRSEVASITPSLTEPVVSIENRNMISIANEALRPSFSDIGFKRLDLGHPPERPTVESFHHQETALQRLSNFATEGLCQVDKPLDASRQSSFMRQNDAFLTCPAPTSGFVRFSESEASLQRQRTSSLFQHTGTRHHRLPDTALPRPTNPTILRGPAGMTGEDFLSHAGAVAQSVPRSSFHNSWSGQELQSHHWNQPSYLQPPVDRQPSTAASGLLGKDSYLTSRDLMFESSCRGVTDRRMFTGLSSPQPQRELTCDAFPLERFDLGSYFSTHAYSGASPLEYSRPNCGTTQKNYDDRYRQPVTMTDLRALPQSNTSDMFGSINVNSSFNLEKCMYSHESVYHSQHLPDNTNSAFLTHSNPTHHQAGYFSRDYSRRALYSQGNPYALMDERQYSTPAKLTQHPTGVSQDRDFIPRLANTDSQLQESYRCNVLYNVMNRYFE